MYDEFRNNAIVAASGFDPSDYFYNKLTYFSCGFSTEAYYNYPYATAVAIIGRIYGGNLGQRSDYCKGIIYLAQQCELSHNQIKSLRKKFKSLGGYKCRVPFEIYKIINKLIDLLEAKRDNDLVKTFLSKQKQSFYINILIEEHDTAISRCAKKTKSRRIKQVRKDLNKITKTI